MNKPVQQITVEKMLESAKRYAEYDKSDPFAYARARSHILQGIATPYNSQGQEAFYGADPFQEGRSYTDGGGRIAEYSVTVYRNIHRP